MDKLPFHIQKLIAQKLSIKDIQNCFLAHRQFHGMLRDVTVYNGWTFSRNMQNKFISLIRYVPDLSKIMIHVHERSTISHKTFSQLVYLSTKIKVSLSICLNPTIVDKLKKTSLNLEISYAMISQQQVSLLDYYAIKEVHLYLYNGVFQLSRLTNTSNFRKIERLTIYNFNEQSVTYTKEELNTLAIIPYFSVYIHGNATLISFSLLMLCTGIAGVSLTTFATLSHHNLSEIIFYTLESHLLLYHFELQYFLKNTAKNCTLCLKNEALLRAEIAILAKIFLDTGENRNVSLEISMRDYNQQQDICANLILIKLNAYSKRITLINSQYSVFTTQELLEELKKIDTISYYTWI